ncbi:MAG: hypothetical protein L0332_07455 [Chloroflexi bacterium]|nr:hypothetical protein [Chloroflexota bacterium]MCI0649246.1 hypothetical protein [Chloroflexota bacterium]MCI0726545.1 hypothetical protein [Chloroflexota bacterium]
MRGGSWNNNQRKARVSVRHHNNPDNWNNNNGFRLVAHAFRSPPAMLWVGGS